MPFAEDMILLTKSTTGLQILTIQQPASTSTAWHWTMPILSVFIKTVLHTNWIVKCKSNQKTSKNHFSIPSPSKHPRQSRYNMQPNPPWQKSCSNISLASLDCIYIDTQIPIVRSLVARRAKPKDERAIGHPCSETERESEREREGGEGSRP